MMQKVRCYECGKSYDYDEDGFCPNCGAFNQPPRSAAIGADGAVVRMDGLNERGHKGSFVHREFHEENRERAVRGLSRDEKKYAARPACQKVEMHRERSGKRSGSLVVWIILGIIALNVFSGLVEMLL